MEFVLALFVLTQNSCRLEQVVFKDSASSLMHKVIMLWRKILPNFSKLFFVLDQQSVGATLEQVFLAERWFFVCQNTKN